ncbi:MAG TPA: DUF6062 family protein [Verrucomicrobiae bacterium]|nr:DUF6062 family protein [Verrucomicrobiae bacterium]
MKRPPPERHTTFFNLMDAMAEEGCALCRLVARAEHDALDALLYENVNDPGTRDALSASLGFCPAHAELATQMSDAFGIAVLYEALCRDAAARITRGQSLETAKPCPICRAAGAGEDRYLGEFCLRVSEPEFRDRFLASEGFCLPHFQRVAAMIRDPATGETVRAHVAATLLTLADELRAFIDKHDYKKAAAFGPEATAWLRALEKFSGKTK